MDRLAKTSLAESYVYNSTYAFSENKVTSHVELEGLEAVIKIKNPEVISNIVKNAGNWTNESERLVWVAVSKGDASFTPDPNGNEGFMAVNTEGIPVISFSDGKIRTEPKEAWVKGGVDAEVIRDLQEEMETINKEIDGTQKTLEQQKKDYETVKQTRGSEQGDPRHGVLIGTNFYLYRLQKRIDKTQTKLDDQKQKKEQTENTIEELQKQDEEAKKINIVTY